MKFIMDCLTVIDYWYLRFEWTRNSRTKLRGDPEVEADIGRIL